MLATLLNELRAMWVGWYDPFYGLCLGGFLIAVGVSWLAWLIPVLRGLAGAVVVGIGVGLFGYRMGQKAEWTRNTARHERQTTEGGQRPFWPWDFGAGR